MKSLTELQSQCEEDLESLLKTEPNKENIQEFLQSFEDVVQERIDIAISTHETKESYDA